MLDMLETILERMRAQELNYTINPDSYAKPTWDLAKSIIEDAKGTKTALKVAPDIKVSGLSFEDCIAITYLTSRDLSIIVEDGVITELKGGSYEKPV